VSDTIVVHHLDNSRSHRVLWILEELEVPYEIVAHQRDPVTMRGPRALRDIHPLGKAPVVVFPDGRVVAESGPILEELVDQYGPHLRPAPDTDAARRYRYFMHYAEGSLMPPLLVKLLMTRVAHAPVPFFVRAIPRAIARKVDAQFTDPEIATQFAFLDGELADREWICGDDFSAADVQLSFPLLAGASRGGGYAEFARIGAWLDRCRARDGWLRAVARGGPLAL